MPSVEERLAYLEGRVGDQTTALADLRGDIRGLRTEISGFRGETKQELASFRGDMDRRFTAIDARLAAADASSPG